MGELALDDIVHIASPSPAPPDAPPAPPADPRAPAAPDIAQMSPDQDQLLRQAEIISALTHQRDLLLYQAEEQRLRWSAEKDGWARMAEALLAQQANRVHAETDEDLDRLNAADSDNRSLRHRLSEAQSRMQLLESELNRLRPLLLMQPLISRSAIALPTPDSKTPFRRRKREATVTEDEDHAASEGDGPMDPFDTPSQASHSLATPRPKSRKSEPLGTNPHKRRPSQKAISRGLSADARAEHLLLAARKIGKHRAGIISGMAHHLEELEQEQRRDESAITAFTPTPKTPRRNASHVGYTPESGYTYANGQMRSGSGIQPVPFFIPSYPRHLLQTPSSSTTAPSAASTAQQKQKQDANPQTPLDSLLNAARSMMREDVDLEAENEAVDVVGDLPPKKAGARHTRSVDMLASPIPKRCKVAARADKPIALHELSGRATDNVPSPANTGGVGRVRSALDVLADQAAAFSTQEQPSAPQEKGKEKEQDDVQLQDDLGATPRSRTKSTSRREQDDVQLQDDLGATPRSRTKLTSRRKEPDLEMTTAVPTSRSSTPQTDLGTKPTNSASNAQLSTEVFSLEAQVDPGGGRTDVPSTSPQTLDSTSAPESSLVVTKQDALNPRILGVSPDPGLDNSAKATSLSVTAASPQLESRPRDASPSSRRPGSMPPGGEGGGTEPAACVPPPSAAAPAQSKTLARVANQDALPGPAPPAKRQRSPYVKWSKEEDDLLAQAVAKYGQKWDLVQKALPSRGYHQVRQRWLRKLGVFDSKPDLSSFQTAATTFPSTTASSRTDSNGLEPKGNPKLGLAPLSSERAFAGRPPSFPF